MDTISQEEAQMNRDLAELRARVETSEHRRDEIIREAEASGRGPEFRAFFDVEGTEDETHLSLHPGQPLRIIRSPEPMSSRLRPDSRSGYRARRSNLPTPPLDTSGPGGPYMLVEELEPAQARVARRSHPLSNSWRAESPAEIDGLGDRNRSPTPGHGWEIMRTTITPDATLPSAESSFTSSAASQSFNASSNNTNITEPDASSNEHSRRNSRHRGVRDGSVSSVDSDELVCPEEEDESGTEAFAEDIYFHEMETPEGRARIAAHQRLRAEEGNRFASSSRPGRVDIGLRLLEEAFNSEEAYDRIASIRHRSDDTATHFSEMLAHGRRIRERRRRQRINSDRAPSPHPERYGDSVNNTVNESRRQVHDYFRRFGADSLEPRSTSPPPQYEPLSSHPNATTFTSRDGPIAQPVSPPGPHSEREDSEALLSQSDAPDLDSMRRIVERLAARDDVPEEWWTSIGLNLSRTRPHNRSPARQWKSKKCDNNDN
ncbi:hypothetical protein PRZ48_012379 [Zasmidium cellare]|uniref:Uncharacterized protein n=1 Tax=Zasmidium cellare TaxID=395010 RepID=A0ABR0E4Q0_ZASCE|nr:hypothetical protein PRZ48_012379 [Zasmidium cellare]